MALHAAGGSPPTHRPEDRMARLRPSPLVHRFTTLRMSAACALAGALALGTLGCGGKGSGKPAGSSQPSAVNSHAAPSLSASVSVASAKPPQSDVLPQGTGVSEAAPLDKAKCAPSTIELATYLQRGELTIGGRDGQVAASWLVQLKDKAQIGFAGFDGEARRIARDRGIGNARERAPTLFPSGPDWIVIWFDSEGLAYARPRWEAQPGPAVNHLTTVKDVPPDEVAVAPTPDGALVVASSFGTQGDQLSLFKFATLDGSQKAEALGFTKRATKPHHPAVAADADGYALAWIEEDGHVAATRLEQSGKEVGTSETVIPKPAATTVSDVTLVDTDTGFQLTWSDGEMIYTRRLAKDATPSGPPLLVGKGHSPRAAASKGAIFLTYLGEASGKAQQLLVVRVSSTGVSSSALRVSDGQTEVKDPPSVTLAGERLAVAWTEVMSPIVSTKRATLRTFNVSCLP